MEKSKEKTCKDCVFFFDMSDCGYPILGECACLCHGGGKNYFTDMIPCDRFEDFEKLTEKK